MHRTRLIVLTYFKPVVLSLLLVREGLYTAWIRLYQQYGGLANPSL
jgi:hypothetical protein